MFLLNAFCVVALVQPLLAFRDSKVGVFSGGILADEFLSAEGRGEAGEKVSPLPSEETEPPLWEAKDIEDLILKEEIRVGHPAQRISQPEEIPKVGSYEKAFNALYGMETSRALEYLEKVGNEHLNDLKSDLEKLQENKIKIIDVLQKGSKDTTALHVAARGGRNSLTKMLIQKGGGAYMESKDSDEETPLCLAAYRNHTEEVQLLLEEGANKDAKCYNKGWTPLHFAAIMGYENVIRVLLQHGADVTLKDKYFRTPLDLAVREGHHRAEAVLSGTLLVDKAFSDVEEIPKAAIDVEEIPKAAI